MLASLLYVSRSTLCLPEQMGRVEEIVEISRVRNAALDVTGALVSTSTHFAQFLEGPQQAIDELMASIRRDGRHTDVEVVQSGREAERMFPDWSMAYAGGSFFVAQLVQPLIGRKPGSALKSESGRLIRMMRELAR